MRIPPLDVILSWPAPNYEHPTTRGEALLVVIIIFSILVVAAVGGRFYSRLKIKKWFGWDDVFIALALVFTLGMNISVILANSVYGWNRHLWDVEIDMYQNAGIVAFCSKLLFVQAATFTRISLILFYYRLVRDSGIQWFTHVLHASMVFVVGLEISFTCVGIWLCSPIQSYWTFPPIEGGTCLNEGTATLVVGVFNCVADLLVTCLPIPLVLRLQMPLKHRVGVCFLLGLGFIVTIAGVVRTYFIWKSLVDSWDTTWYSYPLWIAAAVEIDLAVICACAPALKPLIHKPIVRFTSRISSKISSVIRSRGSHSHSTGDKTGSSRSANQNVLPFAQGDEEFGMLQRSQHSDKSVMQITQKCADDLESDEHDSSQNPWSFRRNSAHFPPLHIVKRQSLEQEISYLDPRKPPATPVRSESFDFR